jgi:hypothetical protein
MDFNTIHKKIQKFAAKPLSFDDFMIKLKATTEANPALITWQTTNDPSHRTTHELVWGKGYSGSKQSRTKHSEGMVNLMAPDTEEGWRTLTYDGIYYVTFDNQKYIIT